ncbi:carbohydrate ABC transporter permease [Breoghania sp.]|uniref:carbohydrate ABC transporter permease n=1 Tax=Breoghania sp. TaxID=2065378 RepID=UPI00262ECA37|nr:carbohydrate ABC transporter permease [Breoghania sp.]MDJ0933032.1 carbohydrate ABC transporter permease [Breoghania sp.]
MVELRDGDDEDRCAAVSVERADRGGRDPVLPDALCGAVLVCSGPSLLQGKAADLRARSGRPAGSLPGGGNSGLPRACEGASPQHLLGVDPALHAIGLRAVFFRQAFSQLPAELFEAARVDGLSETEIVWRIAFPLVLPAATAFAIFSVTAHWNDLFWPMIAISDPHLATPPRGILFFRDQESGNQVGPLMAATVIITAPLVVAFLFAQRKFTQGLAKAGLKG